MTNQSQTITKQTKQKEFQPNQHVFYIKEKVKAVVKGYENIDKILISFYPHGKDKRISKLVHPKYLTEWKSLDDRKGSVQPVKNKTYKNKDNRYYLAVRDFHKAFLHPLSQTPTPMSAETALKRMSWDLEETIEMLHASSDTKDEFVRLYNQLTVNGHNSYFKLLDTPLPENKLVAQVDAIGDKLYFNQGDFNILGVGPDGVFDSIQKSNMGKLWEDGQPRFRESDGKVIKPSNWVAPEPLIKAEIDRQIKIAKVKSV